MSAVLVLWLMCGFLANLPTAFSRPRWLIYGSGSGSGSGIEADVSAKRQSSGCGSFNYANNTLVSPGYPSYYPTNTDCEYWVPIPSGMAMRIDFDAFDVESHYSCNWDYLKISNEQNQTFGKYCGVKDGFHVIVTGDYVVLKFHSDCCVTRPGYLLSFNAFSNATQPPPTTFPTAPTTAGPCGSVQNNTLLSPGYPSYYPNNMDCNYWVYIPYGKALQIYFDHFQVNDCGYDYLKISNEQNQTFGSFCGHKTGQSVIVTGMYAVLTFHSDGSVNDKGYKLIFSYVSQAISSTAPPYTTPPYQTPTYPVHNATTTPSGCGYVQNNELTSPGYPGYYPNNMDCSYTIYISYGKALKIDFQFFGISDCPFDYVKIKNNQNQVGTFCGNRTGEVVYVTGYYAEVTFHSDGIINGQGYKLVFSQVPQANVSTSAPWPPYTTYPTYATPSKPYPSYYPSMGLKCKLQTYIRILQIVLNEMDNVVENELGSKFSAREYKVRVKRALSNVQMARNRVGRQKRDVREVRMADELEKRATELLKRLDTEEAQSKMRALLNRNMVEARPKRAPMEAY
ncbi:tolloid-like protein 2 isoform X1 [Orbicella faveolata]|uniref:tolloid-like protein 2 isoform X1 n=1 Tax=Orbicella faveolata TaxID=48498 RepID=UPI0009E55A64|nr:tolloid-like protein 2 isoform X1 [Orbicella faveolata]